jgi:hypothetical protein
LNTAAYLKVTRFAVMFPLWGMGGLWHVAILQWYGTGDKLKAGILSPLRVTRELKNSQRQLRDSKQLAMK